MAAEPDEPLPAVILITGDDDLLLQRETERRLDRLRAAAPDVDVTVHDVAETDHLPELRTVTLFGGRPVVVLRGVESVAGDLKAEVEDYLGAPDRQATLVLVARGLGRIRRIAERAGAVGEKVTVRRPADWDGRGWDRLVGDEFRALGHVADVAAVGALRAHAGNDPAAIASKVAQVTAAAAGTRISAADVDGVVEGHGRTSSFAVGDAVADRDPTAALVALRGCLESGEAPLAIHGAVLFRIRQLLQVRAGASAKELGVKSGQYGRLKRIAGGFHPGELSWIHDRLAAADLDLKGSDLPADLVLELAVLEIATPTAVGAPWNPAADD